MRGLFVKDLALLAQRKQTLLIFLVVCLIMGFSMDASFIIGYISFFSTIIAMSTISYDDSDNGLLFLMTLPIERKTYVYSKYILGGVFCLIAFVFSEMLLLICNLVKGISFSIASDITYALLLLPLCALMMDLMIPLQLKYGAEKSRLVLLVLFGTIAVVGMLLQKGIGQLAFLNQLEASSYQFPLAAFVAGLILITIVATFISIHCSKRVMEKKTF